MFISVDEDALNELKRALATAGENYKSNYRKLTSLVQEISSGDIQGDPARDFLSKYQAKKEIFDGVEKTINQAEEYVGMKNTQFGGMIDSLSKEMR